MSKQLSEERIDKAKAAVDQILQGYYTGRVCTTLTAQIIEAVIPHFQYIPEPLPVNESVAEAMCEAYKTALGKNGTLFYGNVKHGMTAAASVLVERVLGPVTDEEWGPVGQGSYGRIAFNNLIAARRDRLIPKPEPTLEEEIRFYLANSDESNFALQAREIVALVERRKTS